jgi:signal transduction histidine kinase
VDDVPENLEVLGNILAEQHLNVLVAQHGSSALTIAQAKQPDLILLDVQMPMMDGFTVCEHLKAHPLTKGIPVMFLTALSEVPDIVRGFQAGSVDYITKPFHPQELLMRVRTHLELQRLRQDLQARNEELEREVAERIRAEQALQEANVRLVELNRQKNEFLGIAVHDLKNPLSAITGLAKAVEQLPEMSREEVVEYMGSIATISERMFALIKNLLNINAIEQGGIRLLLSPVAVTASAYMMMQSYQMKAQSKQITLCAAIEPDVVALADESAVIQVLDNLMSNAIKFSPFGKQLWLRVKTLEDCVRIEIQDQGPGLTDEDKGKLFGKFARLSAKPTGDEHSTGLGLSIVKSMIDGMNGRIWVESTIGCGACFVVELPRAVTMLADG